MLFNKIFGAILAVLLAILGLQTFGNIVFGKGGHHGAHHEDGEHSINDRLKAKFAYYAEVEDSGDHGDKVEVVFDLGKLLAAADVEKGAKSFRSKCASCHTIDDGGPNGTGPNLHDVVGRVIASHEGFGYSAPMQAHQADYPAWSYEALNEFLENPKGAVSGTAMAFAGLRKEPERMDVIAYLASVNPGAPAFPEPLPEATDDGADAGDHGEADPAVPSDDAPVAIDDALDGAKSLIEDAKDVIEEKVEDLSDDAEEAKKKVEEHTDGH